MVATPDNPILRAMTAPVEIPHIPLVTVMPVIPETEEYYLTVTEAEWDARERAKHDPRAA